MERDPHERESELGDDSPGSPIEEEISDLDSGRENEDMDSCDEIPNHNGVLLAEHDDVLAKLKMQVRDIKDDFESARHILFNINRNLNVPENFNVPAPFPFTHPAAPFLPPLLPPPADPSSGSSLSSEGSASSQHTWSFEEQFKQVRQLTGNTSLKTKESTITLSGHESARNALYEINDDPKRKEFLDDLFSFMQKRGTPINRLPIMAKSVLDLYELYNLVIARGGLVDVINKKLWQEIIKGLHLPSSITSAAFTLRTQYMKYLYPYECDRKRLSTPQELQAAIDGNRREGRRSSYGQYDSIQRSPNPSQMSPLSLVSQHQQLARLGSVISGLHNGAHLPSHPPPLGQPLNPMEMSRLSLWNLYNNNQQPVEPQKEALNLADTPQFAIKRETDERPSPPPPKKVQKCDDELKPLTATRIKIDSRGDSRTSDGSLVVSMEFNGTTYQGVLFAQAAPSSDRSALTS